MALSIEYFTGQCRHLEFRASQALKCTRLINHVIHIADVMNEGFCRILCLKDYSCVSYNFMTGPSEAGKRKCELNNYTHEGHENDLEENSNYAYMYHLTKVEMIKCCK